MAIRTPERAPVGIEFEGPMTTSFELLLPTCVRSVPGISRDQSSCGATSRPREHFTPFFDDGYHTLHRTGDKENL